MATSAANPTRTPSGILTFLGGIVLLGLFAAIVVFYISSKGPTEDVESRRAAARIKTRETLDKEAADKLSADGWVDKTNGIARIALADAMKLTVDDLKKKQVAPSAMKVEAPLPIPVADPNSKEPPTPALPSAPQGAYNFPFTAPTAPRAETPAAPAPATPAPAPATPAPAPATPAPAPATPAPAPATPAPAPATPAPAPATPAPAPATPAPAPATPEPAPATPPPPPAAPADAQPVPTTPQANATPATRQPLINWTETK